MSESGTVCCRDSGCQEHWPSAAAWTSYEHAIDLIEAQTGAPPGPAGTAVDFMVTAAARRAAAARRGGPHPLDAALAAAYDVLTGAGR